VQLRVVEAGEGFAQTRVMAGTVLSDRKGVNIPGSVIPIPAMTDKDHADLAFALEQGVDWVALSFVQRGSDMLQLCELVQGRAGLIAKIEKPSAVAALDEILDHCDAIMVARGDLGVELSPQEVPVVQKKLVRASRARGLPVIVATQMLESMTASPAPTRAEASDVANAVYEGVDAVMLSAETAAGHYPVETVAMMDRVIASVESDERWADLILAESRVEAADTLIAATVKASQSARRSCIAAFTATGRTALRLVRERPQANVVALSPDRQTARRLALAWGVETRLIGEVAACADLADVACAQLAGQGAVAPGDPIFVLAGLPMGTPGHANILRMVQAPG
jgi:pyruvate kinase